MKFKDITKQKPDVVALMKTSLIPYEEGDIKIYKISGTDTMVIHHSYISGQYGSLSNTERPVKESEIKRFITTKMKTRTQKVTISISSNGVVHIQEEYAETSVLN
ncbi:hypothetical protein [Bacillus vallismortis]|uniref:hypothetical protein n=1 Tax=Bacillus vallismortis TaxID=72361 RepID=UPI0020919FCE|nr:hypothetical protein [Bacillus vallismortis]MCO4849709.1 hypothetical protein [Bacillus vallismortis]